MPGIRDMTIEQYRKSSLYSDEKGNLINVKSIKDK